MDKYKNFLENKFETVSKVMAVLFAVVVLFAIMFEMAMPVDSVELENHYSQLEMVKQDITSICELENADISIDADGMEIAIKGKSHSLKAFFDEQNNYINAVIEDNRVGSSIILSIFVVIAAFGYGYLLSYALLALLCIPLLIHAFIMKLKKKTQDKKQVKNDEKP